MTARLTNKLLIVLISPTMFVSHQIGCVMPISGGLNQIALILGNSASPAQEAQNKPIVR